ncbi:MAG: hypothetical protein Unbinned4512contig1001_15 [Prokaryotic dsDNA virus sp.]|nr:MAG: hypothetical protein Unbinned4512contig1001_15 [Prokaryotic dsDNA virus sp.]
MSIAKLIARATDNNEHNDAAILLAVHINDNESLVRLAEIKDEHYKANSLRNDLYLERYELLKLLLEKAKNILSEDEYNEIHNAF